MALVRRSVAVGRATVPGSLPVPHQAPAPGAHPSASPGAAPAPGESAAAAPSQPAHGLAVFAGLGLAVAGGLGAMMVDIMVNPPVFRAQGGMSVFAALFVFAAAVERLLEPITRWMPGRGEQQRYEQAVADMENGVPGATQAVAQHKAAVDRARASRGVLMWGLATGVATVLSAAGGFYLLRMINVDPSGWSVVPPWLDALVTGLVVGSGTKPLHDLINRVQRQNSVTSTPV
ncbi:MAG: hypothetical protein ACM30G_21140 [Micromonosporaceae bacterium]